MAGQPRGYAFVTYKDIKESTLVLQKLNGKLIGSKFISVRLAKNINYDEIEKPKPKIEIPVLAAGSSKATTTGAGSSNTGGNEVKQKYSKQIAIQAIEAKLKLLENKHTTDDFEINKTVSNEIPIIKKYQFNKNQQQTKGNNKNQTKLISKPKYKSHPYGKSNHKR